MKILVIGGTCYFGIPMIKKLIENGNDVTIATRGKTPDSFGNEVKKEIIDSTILRRTHKKIPIRLFKQYGDNC